MIIWLTLALPTLLATFAAYRWSCVLKPLDNPASRNTALIAPIIVAILIGCVTHVGLQFSGAEIHLIHAHSAKQLVAYAMLFTAVLTCFTLLLAWVAGALRVYVQNAD